MSSRPGAEVTIAITSSDTSEGTVSPESLTFDSDNWETQQTVTVTGVDDGEVDGDRNYEIILGPAVLDDSDYKGIDPDDVGVVNEDNDTDGDGGGGGGDSGGGDFQ